MTGVIYARYSSEKQTENSIRGQVRECMLFAEKEGIEIINIYKDEAISGRTATKRPSFMKMISDAQMRLFDVVVVWKGDRFSRSRADAAKYKSELKKLGIRVLSATEANVTGPEAVLMDGINEAFAEYFSVELAAKVERGMTQNVIDGKYNGGKTTVGYNVVDGKVLIHERTGPIIKELFDLYVFEDKTIPEILQIFRSKGYTNNDGRPFSRTALFKCITNKRYYGHYEFKGTVNMNIFPPIVTKEVWDMARNKATLTHSKSISYKTKADYLLSGRLICGECNTYMSGKSCRSHTGKTHYYYMCLGKKTKGCSMDLVYKDEIEDSVIDAIVDFIWNKEDVEMYVKEYVKIARNSVNDAIVKLEKDLKETNEKIKNVQKAIELGANFDSLIPRYNELIEMRSEQEKELKKAKLESGAFEEDTIRRFISNLKLKQYLDADDRKYLINAFVDSIYLYKDRTMRILFNFTGSDGSYYKTVSMESREAHHCINILNTIDLSDTEFELYRIQRDKSQ